MEGKLIASRLGLSAGLSTNETALERWVTDLVHRLSIEFRSIVPRRRLASIFQNDAMLTKRACKWKNGIPCKSTPYRYTKNAVFRLHQRGYKIQHPSWVSPENRFLFRSRARKYSHSEMNKLWGKRPSLANFSICIEITRGQHRGRWSSSSGNRFTPPHAQMKLLITSRGIIKNVKLIIHKPRLLSWNLFFNQRDLIKFSEY